MAKFSLSRGLAQGTSWAPIGFKLGGPKGAGVAFAAGSVLGGMSGVDDKLNRKGYLDAYNRYSKGALSQTRRATKEMGSRMGANLAARGINDSALGAYLTQSNQGRMYGQTLDHLNTTRADMELQLAHAQEMLKQARSKDERDAWARTTNHLYDWMMLEYLTDLRKGWNSPEGAPVKPDDLPINPINPPPPGTPGQRPPTIPTPERPITPLPGLPTPDDPERLPPPILPVPSDPPMDIAPGAPANPRQSQPPTQPPPYPGFDPKAPAGPIIDPSVEAMQEGGTAIFQRNDTGIYPEVGSHIGLDIEGDPMYEGWKKVGVHVSRNGQRYPRYAPDQKSGLGDMMPLKMEIEQEMESELGPQVASFLKSALGDRYADIMTWG